MALKHYSHPSDHHPSSHHNNAYNDSIDGVLAASGPGAGASSAVATFDPYPHQSSAPVSASFSQHLYGASPDGSAIHGGAAGNGVVYPGGYLSREFVARRISEGETGRLKEELKCQACGKGYKHISSLAKHLWEHTPEWNMTSKLLISKHQQVQLLEAASILVSMNEEESKEHLQKMQANSDALHSSSVPYFRDSYNEGSVSIPMTSPKPISKLSQATSLSGSHYVRRSSLSHPPVYTHRGSIGSGSYVSASLRSNGLGPEVLLKKDEDEDEEDDEDDDEDDEADEDRKEREKSGDNIFGEMD